MLQYTFTVFFKLYLEKKQNPFVVYMNVLLSTLEVRVPPMQWGL